MTVDLEATDAELKEALETVADPAQTERQLEELRKYSAVESLDCTCLSSVVVCRLSVGVKVPASYVVVWCEQMV